MIKILNVILTFLPILIFAQDEYISTYSELYLYDSLKNNYYLHNVETDTMLITIDTIYNQILFKQITEKPFCLNDLYTIYNKDYSKEEKLYYFFTINLHEKFIILKIKEHIISVILEDKYVICYIL